jgi:hypothetical protein
MATCPNCNQITTSAAVFCPSCGAKLSIAQRFDAVMEIRQDVRSNAGKIIGVQTGKINGNVIAESVYQSQVYVLTAAARAGGGTVLPLGNKQPYLYLTPYTFQQQQLFFGREKITQDIMRRMSAQPALAVVGGTGVGKTSLLNAGVVPELLRHGALVANVPDYSRSIPQQVSAALQSCAGRLNWDLTGSENLSFSQLMQRIKGESEGTFVLVLDDFHQVLSPAFDPQNRKAIFDELAAGLEQVGHEYLRIILSMNSSERLAAYGHQLPGLNVLPVELLPLTTTDAISAIKNPLEVLQFPEGIGYQEGFVRDILVPAIDALDQEAETIMPTDLQIVCYWLYREAFARRRPGERPSINQDLYQHLHGVEGILNQYLLRSLESLGSQAALGQSILEEMMLMPEWVTPTDLGGMTEDEESLARLMESMTQKDFKLLTKRHIDSRVEFSFANQTVKQSIALLASEEKRNAFRAPQDVKRIWAGWELHAELPSQKQLAIMQTAQQHIDLKPEMLLLLLRSAVANNTPARPWINLLRAAGAPFLQQMDDTPCGQSGAAIELLEQLQRGSHILELLPGAGERKPKGGYLMWTAVKHDNAVLRRTNVLAVSALSDAGSTFKKLVDAVGELESRRQKRKRLAELRGTLADADPEHAELLQNIRGSDRIDIYRWRVWQRIKQQRFRILGAMVGAGLIAGLALGIYRWVIGLLSDNFPANILFSVTYFRGSYLAAIVALAMALADPLLLRKEGDPTEKLHLWNLPVNPDRIPALTAAFLGGAAFWSLQTLPVLLGALSWGEKLIIMLMALFAGTGLAGALCGRIFSDGKLTRGEWLKRGVWVVGGFGLSQLLLILSRFPAGLPMMLDGRFFFDQFSRFWIPGWSSFTALNGWYDLLALLDAILAGCVLAVGMIIGLRWGRQVGGKL